MRGVAGVRKSIHQSWLAKRLGVKEEIRSEEASTLQIGSVVFPPGKGLALFKSDQWHFHQDNASSPTTPSLSQTIWPRWASRQFLILPIVQTLFPVTFGYSLRSEAVVLRQLRRWKRLWRRSLTRSHKRTSMGHSRSCWNGKTNALHPEEITSKGTRVSCVSYQ